MLHELPWVGESREEGGGGAEETSEAGEGRVREGVDLEVGGEEVLEGGKTSGRRHIGEAEEEVRARVEEDRRKIRLLPAVFGEALRGLGQQRRREETRKSTHSSELCAEDQATLEELRSLRRSRLGGAPERDPEQMRRMKDRFPRRFSFALYESIETSLDSGEEEVERLGARGCCRRLEKSVEDSAGAAEGRERMSTSFG